MSSTVEQVKARLTIVDVVASYLTLEKAGANHRARCPFHTEKTPSFYVSPVRETYHCFGCNRGGDIFTFVGEIEGLDFLGALKVLAARAGVPLEPINRAAVSAKERLQSVLEAAVTYFAATLEKMPAALAYLRERGLTNETIKSFRLGFAPADWRGTADYLTGRGFTARDLEQSGLVVRSGRSGRTFDRFRNRIMFPIADGAGRTIAFSGRLLETSTPAAEAKYINSPDTLLYNKSRVLYLFDRAKLALRRAGRAVLVEGQFDAVLSHQAGIVETIAVSGTALSGEHLDLIHRLINKIVMAFDGDAAGVKASSRAITLALERGFEVQVAILPNDQDPADVIRESGGVWEKALTETLHVIDFLINVVKRRGLGKRELAHGIEQEVYPYIAALANPIDQAYFIRNIAELVGLPEAVIRAGVERVKAPPASGAGGKTIPILAPTLTPTRRSRLEELILGFIVWRGETDGAVKTLVSKRWGDELLVKKQTESRGREAEQALTAEITYDGTADLEKTLPGLLDEWQAEAWREELTETVAQLKLLDPKTKPELVDRYLKRCQELSQHINNEL